MQYVTWNHTTDPKMDSHRPLRFVAACPCGCDQRSGPNLGYISGAQEPLGGFSIIAESDDDLRFLTRMAEVIGIEPPIPHEKRPAE